MHFSFLYEDSQYINGFRGQVLTKILVLVLFCADCALHLIIITFHIFTIPHHLPSQACIVWRSPSPPRPRQRPQS